MFTFTHEKINLKLSKIHLRHPIRNSNKFIIKHKRSASIFLYNEEVNDTFQFKKKISSFLCNLHLLDKLFHCLLPMYKYGFHVQQHAIFLDNQEMKQFLYLPHAINLHREYPKIGRKKERKKLTTSHIKIVLNVWLQI